MDWNEEIKSRFFADTLQVTSVLNACKILCVNADKTWLINVLKQHCSFSTSHFKNPCPPVVG